MSSSIVLPNEFDVSKVNFGSLKTLESGGKSLYLNYSGDKFIVQTPEMHMPYGLTSSNQFNKNDTDTSKPEKWSMSLSFRDMDNRPMLQKFFNMIQEMDKKIVETACEKSFEWLRKKNTSREIIQELYTPMIKYAKDKNTGEQLDFPPTIRVGLPFQTGEFKVETYDNKRNKVRLNDVETKGAKVAVIMQCMGVWIVSGRFGCNWKALQVRITPPATIKEFAFLKTEEDNSLEMEESDVEDDGAAKNPVAKNDIYVDNRDNKNNRVDSSDGEGDDMKNNAEVEEDDLEPPPQ